MFPGATLTQLRGNSIGRFWTVESLRLNPGEVDRYWFSDSRRSGPRSFQALVTRVGVPARQVPLPILPSGTNT
jgi:hypothetical protein